MSVSVKTILYRQIISLIQASPDLYDSTAQSLNLLKPGTLIRLDQQVVDPRKKNATAADFPQLIVSYNRGRWFDDSSNGAYGDQLVDMPPMKPIGRPKTLTQGFVLTLTYRDLQALINDNLEIALIEAIEANGPNLGISQDIIPFTSLGDINITDTPITNRDSITAEMLSTRRAQSTLTFDVLARWNTSGPPTN